MKSKIALFVVVVIAIVAGIEVRKVFEEPPLYQSESDDELLARFPGGKVRDERGRILRVIDTRPMAERTPGVKFDYRCVDGVEYWTEYDEKGTPSPQFSGVPPIPQIPMGMAMSAAKSGRAPRMKK